MLINRKLFGSLYFDAEKGKTSDPAGDPAGKPEGGDPQSSDAKGNDGGNQGGGSGEAKFTQADVDRIVSERLERERRKAEAEAQKLKEKAEAEALAQNQKWQELAQKHEGTIKTLEAKLAEVESAQQTLDRYKGALEAHLKTQREGLPAHILALLDKLDAVDQLEYIAANAGELRKKVKVPGTPDPAGDDKLSEAQSAEAQKLAGTFYRNLFG